MSTEDCSLEWHRKNGKFFVVYPDGERSQPFTKEVAQGYAEIFGGEVVACNRQKVEPMKDGGA